MSGFFGGGGAAPAALHAYAKLYFDHLVAKIVAAEPAPWDEHWTEQGEDAEYHLLLYARNGQDSAWVPATNASITVPAGKKGIIVGFSGDQGIIYDPHAGVVEARLRNITDGTDFLPSSYWRNRSDGGLGAYVLSMDSTSWLAAGKTYRLELYCRNDAPRSTSAWCAIAIMDA